MPCDKKDVGSTRTEQYASYRRCAANHWWVPTDSVMATILDVDEKLISGWRIFSLSKEYDMERVVLAGGAFYTCKPKPKPKTTVSKLVATMAKMSEEDLTIIDNMLTEAMNK